MSNPKRNTSYIFLPFRYENRSSFSELINILDKDENWLCIHDEINYFLKYVADKFDSRNPQNCQCFHFELTSDARTKFGIAPKECPYQVLGRRYRDEPEGFDFCIERIQLYCFSTTICIMAFQISFVNSDPLWISSAQYYLKKVSREIIECPNMRLDESASGDTTFLSLSEKMMGAIKFSASFDFFFYANSSTERANILTYIEIEAKDDYKYDLYYLRRCYGEGFLYSENRELDEKEICALSQDIVWGISPEAAACLACPDRGRGDFVRGTFYKNFNAQYLFMYILLLHQKYVLYMFLTMIGIGIHNSLSTLEDYQNRLYEFEADFVFSCVTEVPQYQTLYVRMTEAFSLKEMYDDVREPLISLSEVRRTDTEIKQKERDGNVNKSLFILSLLTFFSALVDSFDFSASFFSWFLGDTGVRIVQIACIAFIVLSLLYVIKILFFEKNKK